MLTAQMKKQIEQFLQESHVPSRRDRWYHYENFALRPLGELLTDVAPSGVNQAANRILQQANLNWGVSGTNMVSALSTYGANGGLLLTTAGADNDQALLSPKTANAGAIQISGIGGTTGTSTPTSPFLSTNAPIMEAIIELPSVAAVRMVCGFKLTTDPTTTTDNDKTMIAFDTASAVSASRFRLVSSTGGTDYDYEAKDNSTQQRGIVAANTKYVLTVGILPTSRIPFFAINGTAVGPALPALTTGCGFMPVIGLQALAGEAKSIVVRSVTLSREI
jgi:hypothetical protein